MLSDTCRELCDAWDGFQSENEISHTTTKLLREEADISLCYMDFKEASSKEEVEVSDIKVGWEVFNMAPSISNNYYYQILQLDWTRFQM